MHNMCTVVLNHVARVCNVQIYSVTQCVRREEACEARLSHGHLCGKLCVFGGLGHSDSGRIDLVEVYSPASNSWARAADMSWGTDEVVAVAL